MRTTLTSRRALLALSLGALLALSVTSTALATHPRQGSGTPFRVPLVNAFRTCPPAGATVTHATGRPSCTPAALVSPMLTTTSTGVSGGFTLMALFCGPPSAGPPPCTDVGGDQQDVSITGSITDVTCAPPGVGPFCAGTPGADYPGPVALMLPIRLTDHASGPPPPPCPMPSGAPPCINATTVENPPIGIPTACVPVGAAGASPGSTCTWSTTLDANAPGLVLETQRQVFQTWDPVVVHDPGGDGSFGPGCPPTCGTGDELPTRVAGWIAP